MIDLLSFYFIKFCFEITYECYKYMYVRFINKFAVFFIEYLGAYYYQK